MTVRLYTEEDLKAVRRAESVYTKLAAATDAYKALYRALDDIETADNFDDLRQVREDIIDAQAKLAKDLRAVVDAEVRRITESTVEVPEVEEVNERIRTLRKDLGTSPSPGELKPCPICGQALTWKDNVFPLLAPDGWNFELECPCGFSFDCTLSDEECRKFGDADVAFAHHINRRDGL